MNPGELAEDAEEPKRGRPAKPLKSVILDGVISQLNVEMRMNTFTSKPEIKFIGSEWRELHDTDEARIRDEMVRRDASVHPQVVTDRLIMSAVANPYHPVQEYLESTAWDRVPRIATWLTKYMGADNTPFNRHAAEAILRAAVRRVYRPGCKFDEAIVFVSMGGTGKSQTIQSLSPKREWVSDSLPIGASPKLVVEGTEGIWLIESAEMVAYEKFDNVKAFLSRGVDGPVRRAYGRNAEAVPRQFVVFGTTNETRCIPDEEGVRRFWPVRNGTAKIEWLKHDRDQLWAEAWTKEMEDDFSWPLYMPGSLVAETMEVQSSFILADSWADEVRTYLSNADRTDPAPGKVLVEDLWKMLGISKLQRSHAHVARLNTAMLKLGYERSKEATYVPSLKRKCPYYTRLNPFVPANAPSDLATAMWIDEEDGRLDGLLNKEDIRYNGLGDYSEEE